MRTIITNAYLIFDNIARKKQNRVAYKYLFSLVLKSWKIKKLGIIINLENDRIFDSSIKKKLKIESVIKIKNKITIRFSNILFSNISGLE